MSLLDNKKEQLKKYLDDPNVRVSIVLWWETIDEHGGITLSSDTLGKLCQLCNDIDCTFIGALEE